MPAPGLELPDDVDALKAMVIASAEQRAHVEARNAQLEARNTHLEAVNKTAEERIARLTRRLRYWNGPALDAAPSGCTPGH